jgi:NitT/TauT family transport system substrate-binding protein
MTEQQRIEAGLPSPEAALAPGRRGFLGLLGGGLIAAASTPARAADALPELRLGILRFGTAQWEAQVAHARHLDDQAGVAITTVEFAAGDAAQTALLAGRVDVILQDWLWVSRQREAGADFTFRPLSSSLGALVAPAESAIRGIADLKGKRLGVAGTPLDKSWALLRVYARSRYGLDLDKDTNHVFGPPPLLQHALEAGQLDVILTFWPFAARAEADGQRIVITMDQVMADLGFTTPVPFVGYVFSAGWAAAHADTMKRFLAATDGARAALDHDDAAWDQLRFISGAKTPAQLAALRRWYRAGHPNAWTAKDIAAAARVYELLRSIGGPGLVGKSKHIVDGTFWRAPA